MGHTSFWVSLFVVCVHAPQLWAACDDAVEPELTIDRIDAPAIPVIDDWQVLLENTPLSDAQLASLAGDEALSEAMRTEMQSRGTWVYLGAMLAAAGTATSSAGWVLWGQDELPQLVTLPLAIGGLLVGVLGLVTITSSIQTPLEPHLAPTPEHRLTRDQARELVARVNRYWRERACSPAK